MVERRVRIGELARRTGVSPDLLRAWERRYGLLAPVRSDGNYRLYTPADEARVSAMKARVEAGVPAGEAARIVLAEPVLPGAADFTAAAGALGTALEDFDDAGSHAALDALLSGFGFETVAREVLLPYLRRIGERWERGETTVAQEHFATVVLRGRLLGLARGWDRGTGPRAVLSCAPGELHELGLILFGLALRGQGWRITYLGADTPLDSLTAASRSLQPAAVVVVALTRGRLEAVRAELGVLAGEAPLWLAGAGVDAELAEACGARPLHGDPVAAAAELAGAVLPV